MATLRAVLQLLLNVATATGVLSAAYFLPLLASLHS